MIQNFNKTEPADLLTSANTGWIRITLAFFLTLIFTSTPAQDRINDSLKSFLKTSQEDTNKVKLLYRLFKENRRNNLDSAWKYANDVFQLSTRLKYPAGIAQGTLAKAHIYFYKNDFTNSLDLYLKAYEISMQRNDLKALMECSNFIGKINRIEKNYPKALDYTMRSIEYAKQADNRREMIVGYIGLSNIYGEQRDFDKALEVCEVAAKLCKEEKNSEPLLVIYSNISQIYKEKGQIDKAIDYELMALRTVEENHGSEKEKYIMKIRSAAYSGLSDLYYLKGDLTTSLQYAKKALEDSDEAGFGKERKDIYRQLAKVYAKLNKYEEAFFFYHQYSELKDSIFNENRSKQIAEMQTKYETEKKENLLKLSELEVEKQKQRSFYNTIAFIIILFSLLLGGWFLYYRYKRKQENLRYEAVIQTLEKERNRIANELHDNTGALISFIVSKTDFIMTQNEKRPEDLEAVKSSASEVMVSLRETLWTLNNKSITNIDLIDKLKVYIKKHLLIPCKIHDNVLNEYILPNDAVLSLYRCAQEIINNINKHSKASTVNITFTSNQDLKLGISISDDGVGFTDAQKEESYGLRNLKQRMKDINAQLTITSGINAGTTIHINYF